MRKEAVRLLEKMAEGHHPQAMAKAVFLINNYDFFRALYTERRIGGEDLTFVEDLLKQESKTFVEEALREPFGRLIAFVKQTERGAAGADATGGEGGGDGSGAARLDRDAAEALVRDFAGSWTGGIEKINAAVTGYFSNPKNGMEILKQVLTQLLLYYTRFQDIIKASVPSLKRDLVKIPTILFEIKKYSKLNE